MNYRMKVRDFLTPDGESKAFIIASVQDQRNTVIKRPGDLEVETTFIVSDCSRSIELEFGLHGYYSVEDEADRSIDIANKLAKARLLRRVVNEFVDAYEAEVALYVERIPEAIQLRAQEEKQRKKT